MEEFIALCEIMKKEDKKALVDFLLNNFEFFDNVCKYIINNEPLEEPDYGLLNKYSFEQIYFMTRSVLDNISSRYGILLDQYLKDGIFILDDESDKKHGSGSTGYINGKKYIRLGLHGDINDVYLAVHEFIHSINSKEVNTREYDLLTEPFAVCSEFFTYDFLKNKNIEEIEKFLKIREYMYYKRILQLNDFIEGIKLIQENPEKSYEYAEGKDYSIFTEYGFYASIQYSMASIISNILYARHLKGVFPIEEYTKLNEYIASSEGTAVFDYLFKDGLSIEEYIESRKIIKENVYENSKKTRAI